MIQTTPLMRSVFPLIKISLCLVICAVGLTIGQGCGEKRTAVEPGTQLEAFPTPEQIHPDYTFQKIDPTWEVEVSYLIKVRNAYQVIKAEDREPGVDYFLQKRYFGPDATGERRAHKIMTYYPAGQIKSATDWHWDMAGKLVASHSRSFHSNGRIASYVHQTGPLRLTKIQVDPDGTINQLVNGRGVFRWNDVNKITKEGWYAEHRWMLEKTYDDGELITVRLYLNTGNELRVEREHNSEWLTFGGERWKRSIGRDDGTKMILTPIAGTGTQAWSTGHLLGQRRPDHDEYVKLRTQFLEAYVERVKAADYRLEDLDITSLVPDLLDYETAPKGN